MSETSALCPLPPELLDLIVDQLQDKPRALKACCVVSKSWIPRARWHLFNHVKFHRYGPHVGHWRQVFPDLSESPVHNTRTLSIGFDKPITDAEAETLRSFSSILHLNVDNTGWYDRKFSFDPLHGLSHVMRSLHLSLCILPFSEVLGLACSFPLLEDLWLLGRFYMGKDEVWEVPPTSPRFTGSFGLRLKGGVKPIVDRLVNVPNGLHFKRITVECETSDDVVSAQDLVLRCSDTLETVGVIDHLREGQVEPLNLTKATNLKRVEFECTPHVKWIVDGLRTTKTESLQSVLLVASDYTISKAIDTEDAYQEWTDLDDVLVQLWTLNSVRTRLKCQSKREWEDVEVDVARILPESTRRGVVDLVECDALMLHGIEWISQGLYESG